MTALDVDQTPSQLQEVRCKNIFVGGVVSPFFIAKVLLHENFRIYGTLTVTCSITCSYIPYLVCKSRMMGRGVLRGVLKITAVCFAENALLSSDFFTTAAIQAPPMSYYKPLHLIAQRTM